MIAHHLTTLEDCDRILEMDKGRIKDEPEFNSLHNKMVEYA